MQNEFEKQVQQKMEELNLVPSPPVWQNIEKQIRQDKEKRRAIIWIPVFALLLIGGGIWFQATQMNQAGKAETTIPASVTPNGENADVNANPSQSAEEIHNKPVLTDPPALTRRPDMSDSDLPGRQTPFNNSIKPGNTDQSSSTNSEISSLKEIRKNNFGVKSSPGSNNELKTALSEKPSTNVAKTISGELSDPSKKSETEKKLTGSVEKIQVDTAYKKDSVIKDVVITEITHNEPLFKPGSSSRKWKLGIAGSMGLSGEGNGIRLSNEKSLDQLSTGGTSSPPLNNFAPGSPIQNSFSYGIGLAVKKEMAANLSLVSGANLSYYSSSRKVGKRMQDSTLPAGLTFTEFYLNSGQAENNVRSEYYFISVPVMLEWKFVPGKTFLVQGGISVQQLIASKAYQYDQQNGIYYKDAGDINKTQVFASLMLGYEFMLKNKRTLTLGPSLQYGITKMTDVENKHLFFAGINVGYFFR